MRRVILITFILLQVQVVSARFDDSTKLVSFGYGAAFGADYINTQNLNALIHQYFPDNQPLNKINYSASIQLLAATSKWIFAHDFKMSVQNVLPADNNFRFNTRSITLQFAYKMLEASKIQLAPNIGIGANFYEFKGTSNAGNSTLTFSQLLNNVNHFQVNSRNLSANIGLMIRFNSKTTKGQNTNDHIFGIWPSINIGLNEANWYTLNRWVVNDMKKSNGTSFSIRFTSQIW